MVSAVRQGVPTSRRRVLKTRQFARWARGVALDEAVLCNAVAEMAAGLVDADLGGGLVKKRVGLPGRGKRGGARTVVATSSGDRWFFILGFAKNESDNIDKRRHRAMSGHGRALLTLSPLEIDQEVGRGKLEEICRETEDETRRSNHGDRSWRRARPVHFRAD